MLGVRYEIAVEDADAHLLRIEVALRAATGDLPAELDLFLPVWAPGSYLVREYARHVERVAATVDGAGASVTKVRKNAWRVRTRRRP